MTDANTTRSGAEAADRPASWAASRLVGVLEADVHGALRVLAPPNG